MKNPFILLFLLMSAQSLGQVNWCDHLVVTDLELGIDELGLLHNPDTMSVIKLTMENNCKDCESMNDYPLLIIYDAQGDTLAGVSINGIPRYNKKPRIYTLFCNKRIDKIPDPSTLRIYFQDYCDDMAKEMK